MDETKIVVWFSQKGGVGKTTGAYELAYELDGVLVDFEHDGGGATGKWGYRPLDRTRIPILDALASGRVPRPLKGHRKPRLVPGHPDLIAIDNQQLVADSVERWAKEWDTEWVIIDTHPGITAAAYGALSVAHAVLVPTPLQVMELEALGSTVRDFADYPLIVVPSMIPPWPPAKELAQLRSIIEGTPVQVSPMIPHASSVGRRSKRMAITAEDPPRKSERPVADAYRRTAQFVREYVK